MRRLKRDFSREILFEVIYRYHCVIEGIVDALDSLVNRAYLQIEECQDVSAEWSLKTISNLPDLNIFNICPIEGIMADKPDLFELAYLRLIQYQFLGRQHNILDTPKIDLIEEFVRQGLNTNCQYGTIEKKGIKSQLKKDRQKFFNLVFSDTNIMEKNDEKSNDEKYDEAVKYIEKIIDILTENAIEDSDVLPIDVVVTALQCYIAIDEDIKVENKFYLNRQTPKSLKEQMRVGKKAYKKSQLEIAGMIWHNHYMKCGKKEIADITYKYIDYIDKLIVILMSYNNIKQIQYNFLKVYMNLDMFLYTDEYIQSFIEKINDDLIDGYRLEISDDQFIPILSNGDESLRIDFINTLKDWIHKMDGNYCGNAYESEMDFYEDEFGRKMFSGKFDVTFTQLGTYTYIYKAIISPYIKEIDICSVDIEI